MIDTDINPGITQELPAVKRTFKMLQPTKDELRDQLKWALAAYRAQLDRALLLEEVLAKAKQRMTKIVAGVTAVAFAIGGAIGLVQ